CRPRLGRQAPELFAIGYVPETRREITVGFVACAGQRLTIGGKDDAAYQRLASVHLAHSLPTHCIPDFDEAGIARSRQGLAIGRKSQPVESVPLVRFDLADFFSCTDLPDTQSLFDEIWRCG